ncbi:hypothetical protein AVEN_167871-1 [Araneus ventricosus]|uniref:Uncharacterized protein n=1 Tax=Araneus ventricosus TaxID=182803 RepID=A0A4Y2X4Y5_ARAVE|nr:hypothetical protein AVEN_167871-1 [Araneus ventricosus]
MQKRRTNRRSNSVRSRSLGDKFEIGSSKNDGSDSDQRMNPGWIHDESADRIRESGIEFTLFADSDAFRLESSVRIHNFGRGFVSFWNERYIISLGVMDDEDKFLCEAGDGKIRLYALCMQMISEVVYKEQQNNWFDQWFF